MHLQQQHLRCNIQTCHEDGTTFQKETTVRFQYNAESIGVDSSRAGRAETVVARGSERRRQTGRHGSHQFNFLESCGGVTAEGRSRIAWKSKRMNNTGCCRVDLLDHRSCRHGRPASTKIKNKRQLRAPLPFVTEVVALSQYE